MVPCFLFDAVTDGQTHTDRQVRPAIVRPLPNANYGQLSSPVTSRRTSARGVLSSWSWRLIRIRFQNKHILAHANARRSVWLFPGVVCLAVVSGHQSWQITSGSCVSLQTRSDVIIKERSSAKLLYLCLVQRLLMERAH